MKKLLFVMAISVSGLFFVNFTLPSNEGDGDKSKSLQIEIPENVQGILDNSCYGCHNSTSKNEKSRKKLSFDQLNSLKKYKAVGKLADISETLMEGEMPPEKFLDKYPDHALNDADKMVLMDWAKQSADKLTTK